MFVFSLPCSAKDVCVCVAQALLLVVDTHDCPRDSLMRLHCSWYEQLCGILTAAQVFVAWHLGTPKLAKYFWRALSKASCKEALWLDCSVMRSNVLPSLPAVYACNPNGR